MNTIKSLTRYTLYTLLALVFLTGCSELSPNSETFVVRKITKYDEIYRYEMYPTEGRGWLYINSEHFYNVGDTLTLKPN